MARRRVFQRVKQNPKIPAKQSLQRFLYGENCERVKSMLNISP